jgi:hypothetical protein
MIFWIDVAAARRKQMITKLVGGLMAVAIIAVPGSATATTVVPTEQVYAKSAPIATEAYDKPVVQNTRALSKPKTCKNWLVRELKEAGFKGKGLHIAWAIAMRESGGRADAISSTGDYGVFQFNRAAHSKQPWWNTEKLLTRDYNIMIAYDMSQGGKTFYPWDIDGKGNWKKTWSTHGSYASYKKWFNKYPCK